MQGNKTKLVAMAGAMGRVGVEVWLAIMVDNNIDGGGVKG